MILLNENIELDNEFNSLFLSSAVKLIPFASDISVGNCLSACHCCSDIKLTRSETR